MKVGFNAVMPKESKSLCYFNPKKIKKSKSNYSIIDQAYGNGYFHHIIIPQPQKDDLDFWKCLRSLAPIFQWLSLPVP